MAKNRILFCIVFLLVGFSAFSQELVQRFSWEQDEYASAYEIWVERRTDTGTYTETEREFTRDNFVEFSLRTGFYRYRIQAYDLLDRPAGNPPWVYVEVVPVPKPEPLAQAKPEPEPEPLAQTKPEPAKPPEPLAEEKPAPAEPEPAKPQDQPDKISRVHDSDYFVSLGYAPLVPIYGALNELLEASFFPIGAVARFAYTPKKFDSIVLGIEGAAYWNYFSSSYNGVYEYTVHGQMIGLIAHGLLQKHLPALNGLINVRAGGGLYSLFDFHKESSQGTQDSSDILFPALSAGISFQWFFLDTVFLGAGLEYLHVFSVDNPPPGYIRPVLEIGMVF